MFASCFILYCFGKRLSRFLLKRKFYPYLIISEKMQILRKELENDKLFVNRGCYFSGKYAILNLSIGMSRLSRRFASEPIDLFSGNISQFPVSHFLTSF